MSPCTSGPCSSNYFLCLPLLDSLFSFVQVHSFSETVLPTLPLLSSILCSTPNLHLAFNIWFHQSLVSPISGFTNLSLPKSPSIHLFSSPSPHKSLLMPLFNSSHSNFLPPYPVTACNSITIMAQCRNTELRTRSIMLFRQFCE